MMAADRAKKRFSARDIVLCALFAAVLCVISPFSLPVGPVPLSLCNFAVMTAAVVLGGMRGAAATAVFVCAGALGLPVFSGGMGGIGHILAPTGGYIVSYPITAALTGAFAALGRRYDGKGGRGLRFTLLGCFLSVILGYIIGTAWYALSAGVSLSFELFAVCVLPFAAFDSLKCVAATLLGRLIFRRLMRHERPKRVKNPQIT